MIQTIDYLNEQPDHLLKSKHLGILYMVIFLNLWLFSQILKSQIKSSFLILEFFPQSTHLTDDDYDNK